jgi:hypothetical protein
VLTLLGEHLLQEREYYRIDDAEYEKLALWLKELKKSRTQRVDRTRGGAGESGVILSTERYIPSEGFLLQAQPNAGDEE